MLASYSVAECYDTGLCALLLHGVQISTEAHPVLLNEAVGAAGKSYRPQGTCKMSCLDPKDLWTVETGHATPFCQPFLVSWWLQPDYLTSKLQAGGKSPFRSEGQARRGSINVPLPFLSSLCPPLGSSTADVMEGGGKPVF